MSNTHLASRISVSVLFLIIYAAFLIETAALIREFGSGNLGMRIALLDSQNFIFFPIAGLLALVAFWKPAVLLADAMARNRIVFGPALLALTLIFCSLSAWGVANVFSGSNARSIFEISPAAIRADTGMTATDNAPGLVPIPQILARMKILSSGERGLTEYRAQCDPEWLQFSTAADEPALCFPAGERISVRDCCRAKTAFRQHVNALAVRAPSQLAQVHAYVLPVKCFFLILLFAIGVLLVRYRKRLEAHYPGVVSEISFGLAAGGGVMLIWPLMNAAYLETMSLLVGGGSSSAYMVVGPLIALGFGAWTLLLVFFHLRSYPAQVEYAARIGGFIVAAIGVLRYDDVTRYLSSTIGVGGGIVAVLVFGVGVLALMISILMGMDPADLDFKDDVDKADAEADKS